MSSTSKVYPEINRCNRIVNDLSNVRTELNKVKNDVEVYFSGKTREAILDSLNELLKRCNYSADSTIAMKKSLNNLVDSIEEEELRREREKRRKEEQRRREESGK